MLRIATLSLLALAFVVLLGLHSARSAATQAAATGVHVNEPMVVFDVTGPTFAGEIHRHLAVYNNGFVTIAKRDNNPFGNLVIDVRTANVGPDGALTLLTDLVLAGAVSLPDQDVGAADIPLTTLTLLEGKQLALSRTFSYFDGGPYTGVSSVMSTFISQTFPGF